MFHFKQLRTTTNIFSKVNSRTGGIPTIKCECLPGVGVELTGGGALWSKLTKWYCKPQRLLYIFPHSATGHSYGGCFELRSFLQISKTSKSNPILLLVWNSRTVKLLAPTKAHFIMTANTICQATNSQKLEILDFNQTKKFRSTSLFHTINIPPMISHRLVVTMLPTEQLNIPRSTYSVELSMPVTWNKYGRLI